MKMSVVVVGYTCKQRTKDLQTGFRAAIRKKNNGNRLMMLLHAVTWLSAGLHVFWPVCLLTGVITVACVPAAIENGLFSAISTPLFLLRLIHCLLLLQFRLLLYLRHQPLSLLFQTLPHLCHCKLWIAVYKTLSNTRKIHCIILEKRTTCIMFC